jgi:SnoaL-like polyketide cyclase
MKSAAIALAIAAAAVSLGAQTPASRSSDEQRVAKHIEIFDDLDFNVFTNQKWDQLSKSHSKDIVVHWPDGHQTKGIEKHIEDLKAMFVYAPDTRIRQHPVKFGAGEWTSVIGVMEGTFTKSMPVPNGKPIPPTGKAFKITMATVGRWNAQGTMDEEYLFWDNASYVSQIGLGK